MPELPEVESNCELIRKYCLNSLITNVTINELGHGPLHNQIDTIIHETPHLIYDSLYNKTIQTISRKGKYLWFHMSSNSLLKKDPKFILFHFGMTGSLILKNRMIPTYKSFVISTNWPPKFTKLLITFQNGEELAYCDFRRLGRIKVIDDIETESSISLLAKDCYLETITGNYLYLKCQSYNQPIKTLLLDQQKVCSGIGNWIADEVLFQSQIHPSTKCNLLNQLDCQKLAESINTVIRIACNCHADSTKFPIEWLFHLRWEKRSSKQIKTLEGYVVKYETIGGRTSAYVPELQKLYKTRRLLNKNEETIDTEEEKITTEGVEGGEEEVNDVIEEGNYRKDDKKSKQNRKQRKINIQEENETNNNEISTSTNQLRKKRKQT